MEQLQSILTDLDNKAITKYQAYDLILVLFDVSGRSEQFICPTCKNEHDEVDCHGYCSAACMQEDEGK